MKRLLLALPLLLLAFPAWRAWQGPLLPGYVLDYQPLQQRVVASGLVSSQSRIQIGSEITATVERRLVREGDAVRAGDLLIELRSDEPRARVREAEAALRQLRELERPQAAAALREAQSQHTQAQRERARREALQTRNLLPLEALEQARRSETSAREAERRAQLNLAALAPGASQEQQLEQRLAAAQATLARTRILAPVDGTVQSRDVEPGDLVQPGRLLLELTRADSREIRVALDEKHLAPLAIGQPAYVIADAYPQQALPARVSFIAPAIDSARGTVDVHLEVEDPAPFLRQGMTVSVDIRTAARERALVIPHDALYARQGAQARVRVLAQDGRVEERAVRLGLAGSTLSEVLEGLAAGDPVLAGAAEVGQRARLQPQPLPGVRQESSDAR
ncbi:efflux RND transporter periplasmic adaptor subunit [Pseudomonas sp. NW5]|uniref:efflux RND transporter periplasmic adaptor subunit n=1 Tax=Pseudomonas sp. NW5 TaxID=2934934 RepID=UPI0020218688|nr:efflux RND transporter periplasmic adaptor subunit [Pseudomonas sp. NW5]MCL7462222.1 efflux RND transporter periplasmic adaptor subunit [Pseudomonas sp. NW5]